jgi:uncharacterized delta-60 repeat protein
MELQSDGKIILGGSLYHYDGDSINGILRLNTDASVDTTFSRNIPSFSNTLTLQQDGKILSADNSTFKRILPDGNLDTSFIPYPVLPFHIKCLKIHDNNILVGGEFGAPSRSLIRLKPDGSLDTAFTNMYPQLYFSHAITDIIIQPDLKIILTGYFNTADSVKGLIRLNANGSVDQTFRTGLGINFWQSYVFGGANAVFLSNERLMVAGNFNTFDNHFMNGILMLKCDHTLSAEAGLETGSLKIFPNPATDEINIETNLQDKVTVFLYDINGRLLQSMKINAKGKMNLNQRKGIYLLRVIDNENSISQKIIIN